MTNWTTYFVVCFASVTLGPNAIFRILSIQPHPDPILMRFFYDKCISLVNCIFAAMYSYVFFSYTFPPHLPLFLLFFSFFAFAPPPLSMLFTYLFFLSDFTARSLFFLILPVLPFCRIHFTSLSHKENEVDFPEIFLMDGGKGYWVTRTTVQ